jgi:uncharacterized 2Fe-2S/4Fe-4S cluster protein (DUF4445 family)
MTKKSTSIEVRINPGHIICHVDAGISLRELLLKEGVLMDFPCGGRGVCGQCKIEIDPPPDAAQLEAQESLSKEERSRGVRLACRTTLAESCVVTIPEGRQTGTAWVGESAAKENPLRQGQPLVSRIPIVVDPPTLDNQRADWERVEAAVEAAGHRVEEKDHASLDDLSRRLRNAPEQMSVLLEGRSFLRAFDPPDLPFYGFAVDLGTTTVDLALHNLETGRRIGRRSFLNRQAAFGADVISRAKAFAEDRKAVRGAALDTIREAAHLVLRETGVECGQVVRSVVVGNPIMIHILHDFDPLHLTLAPYVSTISGMVRRRPRELGWDFQSYGFVESLPLISSFVGADTTGLILALGLEKEDETTLAVDIGTNGELVLTGRRRLYATSAAAGPAFEGAQIACGTRAVAGAIYELTITEENLRYEVLGGVRAEGICGTALIQAVAQLLDLGLLEPSGRLLDADEVDVPALRSRIFKKNGHSAFAITEDRRVYLTQKDIRELQLAKGAIRTAIEALLHETGVEWSDVKKVRLAGNFGAGMNIKSELRIGLFPDIPVERVDVVGNAALRGAALALVSKTHRDRALRLPQACTFLELAGRPDFQEKFVDSLFF